MCPRNELATDGLLSFLRFYTNVSKTRLQVLLLVLLCCAFTALFNWRSAAPRPSNAVRQSHIIVVNRTESQIQAEPMETKRAGSTTRLTPTVARSFTPSPVFAPLSSLTTTTLTTTKSTTTTTTMTTTTTNVSAATASRRLIEKYVSFYGGFADGRGLGNQLFDLAAVIYVAELTGRQPAILRFKYQIAVDQVFDLGIERFDHLCPCQVLGEIESLTYNFYLEELVRNDELKKAVADKSIFLWGFFQSWKYTQRVERRLRRHLKFKPTLLRFVDDFLVSAVPPSWIVGFVRVGIHVRRGDVVHDAGKVEFGYTTPDVRYFEAAMRHFTDRFSRVQFIVASNDIDWCRRSFAGFADEMNHTRVNFTYSVGHTAGQDMALLAACEHVIMSTGTYGWWAAWLARGTTIYYADWPRKNSTLDKKFKREDYFPPTWFGLCPRSTVLQRVSPNNTDWYYKSLLIPLLGCFWHRQRETPYQRMFVRLTNY